MFKCPDCERVYKTRTSLTRHSHNHAAASSQHACETCGVVFARRDILNRHKANGHCSAANTGRHRVHTACDACRAARIKCNGELPCRACSSGQKSCTYPSRTGRVSQAIRPLQSSHPSADMTDNKDMFHGRDESVDSLSGDDHFIGTSAHPNSAPSFNDQQATPGHDSKPLGDPGPDVHNVPWPWLHEKDFMGKGKLPGTSTSTRIRAHPKTSHVAPGQTAESIPSPTSSATSSQTTLTGLTNVVETLVGYAASTAFTPEDRSVRRRYWESISLQLADVFQASGDTSVKDAQGTLHELVQIYLQRFNILWPLLNHEQLDPDSHHPVLFLTVTSIGSMFGKSMLQRQYGTLMHERLRRLLSASLYDLEGPDDELIWLAQARLLTQVASLYFGQHQGFSYAQHLAAITIAQLRRMDFFREPIPDRPVFQSSEHEQAHWQHSETRRRLAFGILRTDIYTSCLLNTRPLLTSEEVKMTFPRPDTLWLNTFGLSSADRLAAQRREDAAAVQMPFCDIVRIFLEKQEPKPVLGPVGYELSLFGLQEAVWRFSQDPELFPRLTGVCLAAQPSDEPTATLLNNANERQDDSYSMQGLRSDHSRLLHALNSWSQIVNHDFEKGAYVNLRDTLMSSMLLYRLSRLRLCAPLEDLHHISYRATNPRSVDNMILRNVQTWCKSHFASDAAQQAWDIQKTLQDEMDRPKHEQARFNYLAFCSLHHSAVVLWAWLGYICSSEATMSSSLFSVPSDDIASFLDECPRLFNMISPLGGNSFEAAAHRLRDNSFPISSWR